MTDEERLTHDVGELQRVLFVILAAIQQSALLARTLQAHITKEEMQTIAAFYDRMRPGR
jgi:hypothetical protein